MRDLADSSFVIQAPLGLTLAEGDPSRQRAMKAFLDRFGWDALASVPLSGDASFRRYYRIQGDRRRAIVMDAPPPQEDVAPFVAVSTILRGLGFSAPEVFAEDRSGGFLLIEDFGDDTYTRLLNRGADETALYTLAVDTLVALQRTVATRDALDLLLPYDDARLLAEAALLVDWYLPAALGAPLPDDVRDEYLAIWREVLPYAKISEETLVLRDYHVDNLMLLPDRSGAQRCGLLDFQDALRGPAIYDLVSLLEDARRDVPAALHRAMTDRYLSAFPGFDRPAFRRAAAILAAQRNCKILGIFTRLWKRDGKPGYLGHIPRIWRLLEQELQHPVLAPIARWLDRYLPRSARGISDAHATG